MLELNSTGNVLMADQSNFESFLQLTIRSALSQMAHNDQDRNSQNARGISPQVFSMGQSVQIPGGGELVQVSAPVLIQAEIEQHPVLHQENAVTNGPAESIQNGPSDSQAEQHYDYVPHDGEGRNILTVMASDMTAGLDTRVTSILEASRAPTTLLRPGNGSGLLAHLEALLLNFATLGDLANVINANMSPLEQHRSRFRAHVIENQLNGNSMPSSEDLQSASERLAALPSSISSVIRSAGGELVREWNERPLNIPETIRNVEIATIQQLLRVLLDRHISDAEFSQRIQNCVRDYVRQLVALGNHCFASADETAYVRIVYELLMRGERMAGNPDANLSRLLHLRNCVLPRIAVSIRDQGIFPNIDEIPSRLLAWANQNDEAEEGQSARACGHSGPAAGDAKENQDYNETRNRGATSNGPTPAKKRKVDEDAEPGPSTSRGFSHIPASSQMSSSANDPVTNVHLQDYDGDWRRSFPEWLEVIERDSLSAQTSPRQRRNRSDVYQTMLPEHMRRQVVHENASENDVLSSALQESLRDVFRGNTPPLSDEHMNSSAVLSAMNDLLNSAVRHRLEDDPDFDPNRYPEVARTFDKKP
ncbi:hypothetical protein OESDEN_03411 [Oesophagostomum dentatum]|uniref:Uncharacterized protein n=1 Tax=Oesophagostomum dentatum TaxID=61180 RepID=A0A0B1TMP0_OESDE|nr:hypothetical protein OESDEN_03411 [Oesophagostomum dentatum]